MISKEKRQILRKQGTARMSKMRARDGRLGLPSTREADKALRDGLVRLVDKRGIRKRSNLAKHEGIATRIVASHAVATKAMYRLVIAEIIDLAFVGLPTAESVLTLHFAGQMTCERIVAFLTGMGGGDFEATGRSPADGQVGDVSRRG